MTATTQRWDAERIAAEPYHYGRRGLNEAFVDNIIGKEIAFDIQPYTRGRGKIVAVAVRPFAHQERHALYGNVTIQGEVYDLEVEMTEGSHNGAFSCGVALSPAKDISGQIERITGLSYEELRHGITGKTIVIARCG